MPLTLGPTDALDFYLEVNLEGLVSIQFSNNQIESIKADNGFNSDLNGRIWLCLKKIPILDGVNSDEFHLI